MSTVLNKTDGWGICLDELSRMLEFIEAAIF